MDKVFVKGTAIGFDLKTWKEDPEIFSSILLSAVQTWIQNISKDEIPDDLAREFGKIENAYYGIEGDIHNLSVNIHLIKHILSNNSLDTQFKSLYVSLLTENYIINLRSIYDFTSYFPRICMSEKEVVKLKNVKNGDSINSFKKSLGKLVSKDQFTLNIKQLFERTENDLGNIIRIRDLIIHKGKETIITLKENQPYFIIPGRGQSSEENSLPDIMNLDKKDYPLYGYLRILTRNLINYMEYLGYNIIEEMQKRSDKKKYKLELTALIGYCMKEFNDFLNDTMTNDN